MFTTFVKSTELDQNLQTSVSNIFIIQTLQIMNLIYFDKYDYHVLIILSSWRRIKPIFVSICIYGWDETEKATKMPVVS